MLFLQKRRVTFSKRQVVFYGCLGVEKQHRGKRKRIPRILFVKIPIISLSRAHAYAHNTGVLCFLLSQVSHKPYNPLCNNRLHWFQKQHLTLSHFHAATPPQKLPKTPSSKQLFDLQSKTTRYFLQNDTLFSVKRHVTFHKTIRCFQQNDTLFSIKRYVTFHKTTRCFL